MFQNYLVRIKVKLNSDLTHYMSSLEAGLVGYTMGNAYKDDTYTAVIDVSFENGTTASITLDKLDIIDEDYLNFLKNKEEEFLNSLTSATNIVKRVRPRGGFKKLTFEYDLGSLTFYDRESASKVIEKLEELGKEIKEEIV